MRGDFLQRSADCQFCGATAMTPEGSECSSCDSAIDYLKGLDRQAAENLHAKSVRLREMKEED